LRLSAALRPVLQSSAAAAGCLPLSIDISRIPGPRQQTRRTARLYMMQRTDGRTDTVPLLATFDLPGIGV